jgi:hypothetical protein
MIRQAGSLSLRGGPALQRILLWAAIGLLALPAIVLAETPRAFLATESPLAATLEGIDSDGNITFRVGDKLRVVPTRELAYWGRYRDVEAGPQMILADGSAIRADLLKLDDEALVIGDATGLGRGLWDQSVLPRSALSAIVWQPPAGTADRDRLWQELKTEKTGEDKLLLVGGESLSGTLAAAPLAGPFVPEGARPGPSNFLWHSRGQAEPLAIPASKVQAIRFANLLPGARPSRPALWIGLRDGSLVQASSVAAANDKLTIKLASGGELTTTLAGRSAEGATFWNDVTWLQSSGGDVVWLSDQKTLGYKHIPFLSVDWPYENDKSVAGGRLRAAGAVFPKGLGMHATSRLAYDVAGYLKFQAELSLDESAGRFGSVIFKVMLQGNDNAWHSAYESPILRGGDEPLPISVELKGAARAALIVESADRGDELDHANWLQARLIK